MTKAKRRDMYEPIHENISWFRWATRDVLRDLKRPVFIHKGRASKPLVVVVPYEHFMTMQGVLRLLEQRMPTSEALLEKRTQPT
jgi:hypothetical protein